MGEAEPKHEPVEVAELSGSDRARLFEGRDHGSGVTMFITEHDAGQGADLHRHPYSETFVVREGTVRFTVGDGAVDASAGQIVVVPPNTWHGFKGTSDEKLRMVCIHASDHLEQEDAESD